MGGRRVGAAYALPLNAPGRGRSEDRAMNMRLFERRVVERRFHERRRYDRRMVVLLEPVEFERRQWDDRRLVGFERREPVERRDH